MAAYCLFHLTSVWGCVSYALGSDEGNCGSCCSSLTLPVTSNVAVLVPGRVCLLWCPWKSSSEPSANKRLQNCSDNWWNFALLIIEIHWPLGITYLSALLFQKKKIQMAGLLSLKACHFGDRPDPLSSVTHPGRTEAGRELDRGGITILCRFCMFSYRMSF